MVYTVDSIRELVRQHKGSVVNCKIQNGRRKTEERVGVIKGVYPSLFTVYIEDQDTTMSFIYADVLTRDVELQSVETGKKIF